MRFDFYKFKRDISIEYLKTRLTIKEFISSVIINMVSMNYIPMLVGLYIIIHVIAVCVFAYFSPDNVANFTARFCSSVTAFYFGTGVGIMFFLTITEGRYKNNVLLQVVVPPEEIARMIVVDINGFKYINLLTITLFAIFRISYLLIHG